MNLTPKNPRDYFEKTKRIERRTQKEHVVASTAHRQKAKPELATASNCHSKHNLLIFDFLFKMRTDGNDDKNGWTVGGRVAVEVRRVVSFPPESFPLALEGKDPLGAASHLVRDAWMEFHWRKGGGFPVVIIEKEDKGEANDGVSTDNTNALGKKRVMAPFMMEETITSFPFEVDRSDGSGGTEASLELEYKVTSPGPFFGPNLVQGSHTGRVTFVSLYAPSSDDSKVSGDSSRELVTILVWKVEFDAIRLFKFYQKATDFSILSAVTTVQESVATPRLLTLRTTVQLPSSDDPARIARQEWLDFLYSTTGGGLPLPTIPFGEVLPEGGGRARKKRFVFPNVFETAMVEGPRISDANASGKLENNATTTAYYKLENPGWRTFPFLLHTHLGRVTFRARDTKDTENLVDVTWEIEFRSYPIMAPFVEKVAEMTVSTILRNLNVRLEARLQDNRSVWERLVSLLQPWTWGDSGDGHRVEDVVEYEWSDGRIK
jgi:hypothetical protein